MEFTEKTKTGNQTYDDMGDTDESSTCPKKDGECWVLGSIDAAKEIFVRNNRGRRSQKSYSYPPSRSSMKTPLTIGSSQSLLSIPMIVETGSIPNEFMNVTDEKRLSRIVKNYKNIVQEFENITIKEPVDNIVIGRNIVKKGISD